jgi:phenylpropionate dioxygenase-like ring-hydroxylating dioxygenase large terminal subunit
MEDSTRQIVRSYDAYLSLAESSTPPSAWYTDPRILELERRTVYTRSWQLVGRSDQLREPGQFITFEVAGEPILVVRGNDCILRGFFNVCRHHAAAVATECAGKTENLRCPYHGWTYDLTGALIHTPEFAGVANFDRNANGLFPVQVAEWQNWVFVKLDDGGLTSEEFLSVDLIERLEPLNFERLNWFERRSYFLDCNWKVFVDNYLDGGYHVPHIHSSLSSVLDNSKYKIEIDERFCLQSSPIASDKGEAQTAAVRKGERANYFWIYPNFMINVYEGVMDTNLVIPRGIDKTEVIFDYYFSDVSESSRQRNLASIAVSEQIQSEDVAICESVQRGLNSRAYDAGRLSVRREAGEHLFHRLLHADLTAGLPDSAKPTDLS